MAYELWWRDSLNVTAAFGTERQALAALRQAIGERGRQYAAEFSLENICPRGDRVTVAEGEQLVELALSKARRQERISA